MPLSIDSKLPDVGTTIFTIMSKLAADENAINLSQGYPDFEPPAELLERVNHYLQNGANQYPPMTGVAALREQIARKTLALYGRAVDPEHEVTVTAGATEALFSAIHAVVRPGDQVIVFDPAYDSYEPAVTLAGGVTRHLNLMPPDFHIDWQRLADTINDKTRLIIINSPHNPTGAILTREDLDKLASIIEATPVMVLSDEVYEHIIFDDEAHQSVLRHEALAERSFAVSSFGKTYHATGWKVGYCVAPAAMSREFRRVHQFITFTVVTPIQHALADYLASTPEHYLDLPVFYQQKRDHFAALMEQTRFKLIPSRGTYFQLAEYSELSQSVDTEFAIDLTRKVGVATIPVSVFCAQPPAGCFVRFCFAKQDQTLEQAVERLCAI